MDKTNKLARINPTDSIFGLPTRRYRTSNGTTKADDWEDRLSPFVSDDL